MNYPALKTELTTDPANLGYAAMIADGNDDGQAALLNNTPAAVAFAAATKNSFLNSTAGAVVRLALGIGTDNAPLAVATATKWKALLDHSYNADFPIDLSVIAAMGDPVADKVMSAAEFASLTTRVGTRAELIAGGPVTHTDVALALRG